jgi:hypothetical protein
MMELVFARATLYRSKRCLSGQALPANGALCLISYSSSGFSKIQADCALAWAGLVFPLTTDIIASDAEAQL